MKTLLLIIPIFGLLMTSMGLAATRAKTYRVQEGLVGPVKIVLVEIARIKEIDGKSVEAPRIPWLSTTYDRQGNRIEEDQLYNSESLNFKSIFIYDDMGNLKEGVEYDAKGAVTFKWPYTHDPSSSKIEEKRFRPDGSLFSTVTYLYDAQGNQLEEIQYLTHMKNHFRWIYRYDKEGHKSAESYYLVRPRDKSGQIKEILTFRTEFSYDLKGNLVEEIRHDGTGQVEWDKHFEYKFDKAGNWISRKAFQFPDLQAKLPLEPTGITYRTITYFQK